MKLAAYMPVYNELDRYLVPCLEALALFCDEISVWDDGSTDGTPEALEQLRGRIPGLRVHREETSAFFDHEGQLRQRALGFAMETEPTHILAVDADELILEGPKLRHAVERGNAWSLCMREVWKARSHTLEIRQDGGWCEHPVPILWRNKGHLPLHNRKLASGRAPAAIATLRPRFTDVAVYHFGWAHQGDRRARYERYVKHDGGRFHQDRHLQSIMWPDIDVVATTESVEVPAAWVDRANRPVLDSDGDRVHAWKL